MLFPVAVVVIDRSMTEEESMLISMMVGSSAESGRRTRWSASLISSYFSSMSVL